MDERGLNKNKNREKKKFLGAHFPMKQKKVNYCNIFISESIKKEGKDMIYNQEIILKMS